MELDEHLHFEHSLLEYLVGSDLKFYLGDNVRDTLHSAVQVQNLAIERYVLNNLHLNVERVVSFEGSFQ